MKRLFTVVVAVLLLSVMTVAAFAEAVPGTQTILTPQTEKSVDWLMFPLIFIIAACIVAIILIIRFGKRRSEDENDEEPIPDHANVVVLPPLGAKEDKVADAENAETAEGCGSEPSDDLNAKEILKQATPYSVLLLIVAAFAACKTIRDEKNRNERRQ